MSKIENAKQSQKIHLFECLQCNTIPEIIDKMTIRVPITGKEINVFVLLFILIGISSAAAGYYLYKKNKK